MTSVAAEPAPLLVDPASLPTPPAHILVPASRSGSLLEVVAGYAALGGRVLDAEQRLAVDVITSIDDAGRWAAPVGAIVEPRQNGKTSGVMLPIVLSELFDEDNPDRCVWTAHRFKTSRDAFVDIVGLIRSSPELWARVRKVSDSHGEEAIHLKSGASLEFIARSRMQGRGLGGKVVGLDEFFAADEGMLGALLPTLSARPNPLVLIGSSSCMADSVELYDVVKSIRSGTDPGLSGVEWCATGSFEEPGCEVDGCLHTRGTPGCTLDDVEQWRRGNPAMHYGRLTERFITLVERRRLSPREFARERLGWHEKPVARNAPPIPLATWQAQVDEESQIVGRVAFALEVPLSRDSASIAVAGRREDGDLHIGLIDRRPGLTWVVDRVVELWRKHPTYSLARGPKGRPVYCPAVVIDWSSPAATFVEPLKQAGLEPVLMTTREVAAAAAGLQDGLEQARYWHRDLPDIDVALEGAVRRDLGEGLWAFGRRKSAAEGVDVDPLVAIAHAAWAVELQPAPKSEEELMESFG